MSSFFVVGLHLWKPVSANSRRTSAPTARRLLRVQLAPDVLRSAGDLAEIYGLCGQRRREETMI